MPTYESIISVKEFEPRTGPRVSPRNTPRYHVHRQQFEAPNDTRARERHRGIRHGLEDCFTQTKTLSLNKGVGGPTPQYDPW